MFKVFSRNHGIIYNFALVAGPSSLETMDEPDSYLTALQNGGFFFMGSMLPAGAFLKLLAVATLVVANAFFVASEFALVSVRRTKLEERAQGGSRGAQAALRLLDNPTLLISATQLGVTLASLALGWAGEPTIAALLEPIAYKFTSSVSAVYVAHIVAIVIAFTVITFLHIVLGELMPKMVALERAEPVALFCAATRTLARFSARPLIFNKGNCSRSSGWDYFVDHTSVYTEPSCQLVDISCERTPARRERCLIHRVFEFSTFWCARRWSRHRHGRDCRLLLDQITSAFQDHPIRDLPSTATLIT
jgi:hypothetical protein